MLIDFTVENYRSIKEPVTLSAVASTHKGNKQDENIAKPFIFPERKLELLPLLGIFGANASGKSNVINALADLLAFCFYSDLKNVKYSNPVFLIPFLLDSSYSKKPTNFQLRVIREGSIYIYELSVSDGKVLKEKLEYIPATSKKAITRLLYVRSWDKQSKKTTVKNGEFFGDKFKEIQTSLNDSQIFLNLLISSLKHELVRPFTEWISLQWNSVHVNQDHYDYLLSCGLLNKNPKYLSRISAILKRFDTGIDDIEIKEREGETPNRLIFDVSVVHKTNEGKIKWKITEESLGTQKLFNLATRLFISFDVGCLVLVDELGSSTHPQITLEIVKLFQDRRTNKNGAQLIFASHDTNLQKKGVLRRDQIWFTQKREDGSTDLYPLSDFGERGDLAIDKAYLDGRFGAVPFTPGETELAELVEVG